MSRAEKSGFAAEAYAKIHGKYDEGLAGQLLQWIASITGDQFSTDGNCENFCDVLKDGTVLCKLANTLKPNSIKKVNEKKMAFLQMENINNFLLFAEKEGGVSKNELFQTVDLYERQDPNSVMICLFSLARKSERAFGVAGLGPKESEKHERNFSEDQLRQGNAVIGLQMGSNQGASQAGMGAGGRRHIIHQH